MYLGLSPSQGWVSKRILKKRAAWAWRTEQQHLFEAKEDGGMLIQVFWLEASGLFSILLFFDCSFFVLMSDDHGCT